MTRSAVLVTAMAVLGCVAVSLSVVRAADEGAKPTAAPDAASLQRQVDALKSRLDALEKRVPPPELGNQMIELQIRHDRLWWAGQAGNWNLAYYMVGEMGETLAGIEETNGDAAELQPQKLSEVMPSIMNPAIKGVQDALARKDRAAFDKAYDDLSGACTACHKVAGNDFLVIQRPRTPLLDNLRYTP